MRQVPVYLIIGAGRLALHLKHYFSLLNISYETWDRSQNKSDLISKTNACSHILFAISDDAIESFILSNQQYLEDKICIHFSGVLYTKLAFGAHPLMSFSKDLYPDSNYFKIPFVLDNNAPSFNELFPELKNPNFRIDINKKNQYHMLCVLANNFTTILWEKAFNNFAAELNMPKEVLIPILEQTCENLIKSNKDKSVLTGPFARGDKKTIQKHLDILENNNDDFLNIYQEFAKYSLNKNNTDRNSSDKNK